MLRGKKKKKKPTTREIKSGFMSLFTYNGNVL